ncbi:MAG: ATP-dependent DNA helicase RecG, partial [Betaproteobacteria bacterium]|nr:ATP-dependent DNA helicase RecG [Betaproteobacteria bacterium]
MAGSRGTRPAATERQARLARLGLRNDDDLVLHLPLRYLDLTRVVPIAQARTGDEVQVEGVIRRQEITGRGRRVLSAELEDDSGRIALRLFNFYPSQLRQLAVGQRVRAFGPVRAGLFGAEMTHPTLKPAGGPAALPARLTPVYPAAAGISQALLRAEIAAALARIDWPEPLPGPLRERLGLMPLREALRLLHEPPPAVSRASLDDRSHPAWRTLILDELLAQQLSLREARERRAALRVDPLPDAARAEALLARLPFRLTGAQQRVRAEIAADLARDRPMNRLLQGDVGSGKTVVAALAALQAVGSGRQVALMAPTEILAEQHHRKLSGWLDDSLARVAWLSGSMKEADKRAVRAAVAAGEVDLLIGTHALIQESVAFARLGLAIVDEQHRFGVAQRSRLLQKGRDVHALLTTATPIPRTLALALHGELDSSILDERPRPMRVATRLVTGKGGKQVEAELVASLERGGRLFWIVPRVGADDEPTEDLSASAGKPAKGALERQARLLASPLARFGIELVHGRLDPEQRDAALLRFKSGATRVLVATTVVEVGLDVPDADLLVIEGADQLGLAQL